MVTNFRKLESTFSPTWVPFQSFGWWWGTGNQLCNRGAQGFGEFLHVVDGDVAFAALDAANIIAVEAS